MSTSSMPETLCPTCSAPLTHGGADCPRCLLRLGLSRPSAAGEGGEPSGAPAPSPAELERLFPGLAIEAEIGRGGMGVVYRARQRKLGRTVALKLLAPGLAGDADFAERFLREARVLARLTHDNIVAVYDFGETEGLCWLLMEYVDGADLRRVMETGELSPEAALAIVPQICDALSAAHGLGIVHRDIKPENVLLTAEGTAKLVDFGLAKLVDPTAPAPSLTRAAQAMGTPHYMAPEQMRGARDVDHRADIFSLGVVFYEMLTGQLPIGRFEAPSKRVAVDVRFDEIVLRALEASPERRYQSAVEVKGDVERVSATELVRPNRRRAELGEREAGNRKRLARNFALVIAVYLLLAPALLRLAWKLGMPGLLAFALCLPSVGWLGLHIDALVGKHSWRRRLNMEKESLSRFIQASLVAGLGVACGLIALQSIWMRSTPQYIPPAPISAEWSADAARTRLRALDGFALGDLPRLGEPAVLSSSQEFTLSDLSPRWPGVLCLLLLGASSLVMLSGRRVEDSRAALTALAAPPALTLLALLHAGLWYELPFLRSSPSAYSELAGAAEQSAPAEQAAERLVERARSLGYEVHERRVMDWRELESLLPVARVVELDLGLRSPFERWRLGDDGPQRRRPDLHLTWISEIGAESSRVRWSAGLLRLDAPEADAWGEDVGRLLGVGPQGGRD